MPKAIQVGLNTADMVGSLRLYSEAFGFANAGGQCIWGSTILVQGLDPSARATMWWLIGRQPLFQLELFQHTEPPQRPLRSDWRPNDHGWVRLGIAVPDFDACLDRLRAHGLAPRATGSSGARRAAFRDPWIGVIVEVMEEGPTLPFYDRRPRGDGPSVVYAASSVSDLEAAKRFYRDLVGFPLLPIEPLHGPEHEALWGLEGARRDGFLVDAGDVLLEIVQYRDPVGRPRPADYRASDQGIVNVAFGSQQPAEIQAILDRLAGAGIRPPHLHRSGEILAGYIIEPEREIELVATPAELLPQLGFVAQGPFFG